MIWVGCIWLSEVADLVSGGFVGNVFGGVVDVVHGVALRGDVIACGAGDGVVCDFVGHDGWLLGCFERTVEGCGVGEVV